MHPYGTKPLRVRKHFNTQPAASYALSVSCPLQSALPSARVALFAVHRELQEVLALVRISAADFDPVCMATALHKMASLDADPLQYKMLADRPELKSLKDLIGELKTPNSSHMLALLALWTASLLRKSCCANEVNLYCQHAWSPDAMPNASFLPA